MVPLKPVSLVEYWTYCDGYIGRCSIHRSAESALRHAKKCEREGGSHHDILKVEVIARGSIGKKRT